MEWLWTGTRSLGTGRRNRQTLNNQRHDQLDLFGLLGSVSLSLSLSGPILPNILLILILLYLKAIGLKCHNKNISIYWRHEIWNIYYFAIGNIAGNIEWQQLAINNHWYWVVKYHWFLIQSILNDSFNDRWFTFSFWILIPILSLHFVFFCLLSFTIFNWIYFYILLLFDFN